MKTSIRSKTRRKPNISTKDSVQSNSKQDRYLAILGFGVLLNLAVGVAVLFLLLLDNQGSNLFEKVVVAEVQTDPATGLIIPQKPLGWQVEPAEKKLESQQTETEGWLNEDSKIKDEKKSP